MEHMDVSELVKRNRLYDGWDDVYDTFIVDEDRICDFLEPLIDFKNNINDTDDTDGNNGVIVDYHSCDFFPERWFDLVIVLRCTSTQILYDRLEARQYSPFKISENLQCEIMQVVLDEARDSYGTDGDCGVTLVEMESGSVDDMEANVEWVTEWYHSFTSSYNNTNTE